MTGARKRLQEKIQEHLENGRAMGLSNVEVVELAHFINEMHVYTRAALRLIPDISKLDAEVEAILQEAGAAPEPADEELDAPAEESRIIAP